MTVLNAEDDSVALQVAPIRLLLEEQSVQEVLITSFTANLAFFSRSVAGRARARGARVSLISDPDQTTFDPGAVRGAGVDWLDGRAWCGGTFHPKVIVVAGESGASVLIGSGNATPSGWVDNAELWVRFNITEDECPSTVPSIGEWLDRVPSLVQHSPGVDVAFHAAATALGRFNSTHEGPQLVDNLTQPIIDQLPRIEADKLIVSSPFFDPRSRALEELCERFQPGRLTVVVQNDFHFDGPSMERVVGSRGGRLVRNALTRQQHGKLLEWSSGDERWALVGSPNCTAGGLKSTVVGGGNCEIAVICRLDEGSSLVPPVAETLEREEIAAHRYVSPVDGVVRGPSLVAALLEEAGTRLILRRPSPADLVVEWYVGSTWVDSGCRIPIGVREHFVVGWWPTRGQALRTPGPDGLATTPVAATLLAALERRTASRSQLGGSGGEFIENLEFVKMLKETLARYRTGLVAHLGSGNSRDASQAKDDDGELPGWEERAERLRAEGGERFAWFTLPHLARRAGLWAAAVQTEPGENLTVIDEEDEEALDRAARIAEFRRRRIADLRRWCTEEMSPVALSPIDSAERSRLREVGQDPNAYCTELDVCAAAVVLAADALRAWDDADSEVEVITYALRRLARPLIDPDLAPDAASVAAVGLWLMERLCEESATPDAVRSRVIRLGHELAELLLHVTETGVADRCSTLRTLERPDPPNLHDVIDVAARAAMADPLLDALAIVRDEVEAELTGRTFRLLESLRGDGIRTLLRLACRIERFGPFVLEAQTDRRGKMRVCWSSPSLVVVSGERYESGTLYKVTSSLVVATSTDSGRPSVRDELERWNAESDIPSIAIELLTRLLPTEDE